MEAWAHSSRVRSPLGSRRTPRTRLCRRTSPPPVTPDPAPAREGAAGVHVVHKPFVHFARSGHCPWMILSYLEAWAGGALAGSEKLLAPRRNEAARRMQTRSISCLEVEREGLCGLVPAPRRQQRLDLREAHAVQLPGLAHTLLHGDQMHPGHERLVARLRRAALHLSQCHARRRLDSHATANRSSARAATGLTVAGAHLKFQRERAASGLDGGQDLGVRHAAQRHRGLPTTRSASLSACVRRTSD